MKVKNPSTGNFEEVYVKALDSLPVGTEVDFTGSASDIPAGWEQVDSPVNIITCTQNASVTTGNNTYDKITLVEYEKIGNKLSISNGGVKIGSGVSYIKVSGFITFSTVSSTTSRHHLQIYKNSTSIYSLITRFGGNWETIQSVPFLISVQENDIIYLYTRSQDSGGSVTGASYLLVEVIE
jgi:hypothetical protein